MSSSRYAPASALIYDGVTDALREQARHDRAEREGLRIGFMPWASGIPEPKTGRLNFDEFPFQVELYEEGVEEKEAVVMKATQVGISAFSMRWAIYHADTKARTGLYVFPTKSDMFDFADLRVKPLIDGSDYLRHRIKPDDPQNKGMKGIGPGKVVFRGSENKRGLDSVDCDHIVFDEYDTLDQNNIPDAEMRVSSPLSPGLIRRVGVPSTPDFGIAKLYEESDQRVWIVTCAKCKVEQELDFFKNVDLERAVRICSSCGADIETEIAKGRWVAKVPDQGRPRGYHVSRLIVPRADMRALIKQSKFRSPIRKKVFFNKHLGLPFAEAEGRLSREAIAAAQSAGEGYTAATNIDQIHAIPVKGTRTMGVDVATVRDLNVRVSELDEDGSKKALFLGTVASFDDLSRLMRVYEINMAAVDHLPDGRLAHGFAEQFPGRVYVIHYNTQPGVSQVLTVDEDLRQAAIRRTEAIDAAFELIRMQKNKLPANLPEEYIGDMQALVRESKTDDRGRKTVVYSKKGESDDFAHTEAYDVAAEALWLFRQEMEAAAQEVLRPLDELMEFQRSGLADYDEEDYEGGPGDDMSTYTDDDWTKQ